MIRRSRRELYLNVKEYPDKVNEMISYLSMDFAKNHLLDRDDLAQELYVLYAKMVHNNPEIAKQQPGYFFIKFKWFLLTKWRRRVNEINNEWKYKLRQLGTYGVRAEKEGHGDYTSEDTQDNKKNKKALKKLTKKRKRYGF